MTQSLFEALLPVGVYLDDAQRRADGNADEQKRKRGRPSKKDEQERAYALRQMMAGAASSSSSSNGSSSSAGSTAMAVAAPAAKTKNEVYVKLKLDEDFSAPLTDAQKLAILAHPLDEVVRLRALLAKAVGTIHALQNGQKRPYNAASQTIPLTEFVCDYLWALVRDKAGDRYLFEGDTPLGRHTGGRAPKNYNGPREFVSYDTMLTDLKSECKALGMTGRIGWHSLRKSFGMAVWLISGKDPVACAKLLNHQDTSALLAYLRIEDEKLTQFFHGAQSYLFGTEAKFQQAKQAKHAQAAAAAAAAAAVADKPINGKDSDGDGDDDDDDDAEMQVDAEPSSSDASGKDAKAEHKAVASVKPAAPADTYNKQARLLSKQIQQHKDADGNEHEAQVGKDREKGMRPLKPEEIQLLLTKGWEKATQRKRERMRAIVAFVGSGGPRIGSAQELKVEDVFHVESQSFYKQVTLVRTKGSRENRKRRREKEAEKKQQAQAAEATQTRTKDADPKAAAEPRETEEANPESVSKKPRVDAVAG